MDIDPRTAGGPGAKHALRGAHTALALEVGNVPQLRDRRLEVRILGVAVLEDAGHELLLGPAGSEAVAPALIDEHRLALGHPGLAPRVGGVLMVGRRVVGLCPNVPLRTLRVVLAELAVNEEEVEAPC